MSEKAARGLAKGAFTRSANALAEAISQSAPSVSIQRKFERMCECFKDAERKNEEYLLSLAQPEEDQDEWINELSGRFEQLEIEADVLEQSRRDEAERQKENKRNKERETEYRREEERKNAETRANEDKRSGFKIERLKIEQFEGDLREYPSFKNTFLKFIKPNIREEEESFVLKSYLHKKVRQDVEMMEDPSDVWRRLDNKYGNKRRLVDTILQEIKQLKPCSEEAPNKTLHMIETLEKGYRDLKMLNMEREISNTTILSSIEGKLPKDIEREWVKIATELDDSALEVDMFPELLKLLSEFKRRLEYKNSDIRAVVKGSTNTARNSDSETVTNTGKNRCWLHYSDTHPIWECDLFKTKSPKDRAELVKEKGACFRCLEQGHISRFCRRNFICEHDGCGGRHHTLMHGSYQVGSTMHARSKDDVLLQLQMIRVRNKEGGTEEANVLWDAGSTLSFITFKKAESLKLKGCKEIKLHIEKVGGVTEEIISQEFKVRFVDSNGVDVEMTLLGIEKISSEVAVINDKVLNRMFPKIDDLKRPNQGEIECLIGYDYANFHPVKEMAMKHLLLLKNRFGHLVGGRHPAVTEDTKQLLIRGSVNRIQRISVENFYEIEQLGINCSPRCGSCKCGKCQPGGKEMTIKEEREFNQIKSGLHYDEEKEKWTATYPWIKNPSNLVNNKTAVLGALKSCERRLKRDEVSATKYQEQMEDMQRREVCRKISEAEIENYNGPIHYIPHHEVLKPESESTPVRIVFNSSANFQGQNLNDYLAKGPDMLNNLAGVLLRFRENYIGFSGDISKMFHSIGITERDQMMHLFLWRDLDERRYPETYAIQVVNFGDRPSGAIALAALRETANKFKEEFPTASECVKKNSYMDDILDSTDDISEAVSITTDMTTLLKKGSFIIKEWNISHKDKEHDLNEQEMPEINERSEGKALGMYWNIKLDQLKFKCKLNFSEKVRKQKTGPNLSPNDIKGRVPILTKRKILSQVNGIYDPLGLVAPFIVKAKIMLRKLWMIKDIDWDDHIPDEDQKAWEKFFEESGDLEKIKFKRCMKPADAVGSPMLTIFSDASQDAYGAVAYTSWKTINGSYKTSLIMSKTRITPIKIKDIVKLELAAAVLSKRLRDFITKESRYPFLSVIHIVDSEIVKAMISKESYGFNTYAANRIGEIQDGTKSDEWAWLAGKENISDWITRGRAITEIGEDSVWQNGPAFMKLPLNEWPISKNTDVSEIPGMKMIMTTKTIKTADQRDVGREMDDQIEEEIEKNVENGSETRRDAERGNRGNRKDERKEELHKELKVNKKREFDENEEKNEIKGEEKEKEKEKDVKEDDDKTKEDDESDKSEEKIKSDENKDKKETEGECEEKAKATVKEKDEKEDNESNISEDMINEDYDDYTTKGTERDTMSRDNDEKRETLASRIDLDRFSKLERLLGTTARIVWLYQKYNKTSQNCSSESITVRTLEAAKLLLIKDAQKEIIPDLNGQRYKKLIPRNKEGVIVAGGRCERWNEATWNKQEFVLLPNKHRLSYLIAEQAHRKGGHKGITSTIAAIRREYWIIKVRSLVGNIINKCILCRIRTQKLCEQVMSSLPIERLKPSPPFYHTSVDYFGPFTIRGEVQKRTRGKAYGVIFTCFTTRAVYVDVSHDYSTDAFLQVLRRFACIRGWPKTFYSDRGTQLVSASKELRGVVSNLDESEIREFNAYRGTSWEFSTPGAKWMNGLTEALVKTVKKSLGMAIGEQVLEFSSLQTVMFEASEMVNSRPIGTMPASIDEGVYLAPNDMLLGRTKNTVPQEKFVLNERLHKRYYFI